MSSNELWTPLSSLIHSLFFISQTYTHDHAQSICMDPKNSCWQSLLTPKNYVNYVISMEAFNTNNINLRM